MSGHTNPSSPDTDAEFLGWQKTLTGEKVALYNIIVEGHPSYGSTVCAETLDELNLKVPDVPYPKGPMK